MKPMSVNKPDASTDYSSVSGSSSQPDREKERGEPSGVPRYMTGSSSGGSTAASVENVLTTSISPDQARLFTDGDLRLMHGLAVSGTASKADGSSLEGLRANIAVLEAEAKARGLDVSGNLATNGCSPQVSGELTSTPIIFEAEEITTEEVTSGAPTTNDSETRLSQPDIPDVDLTPYCSDSTSAGMPPVSAMGTSLGLSSHMFAMGEHAALENGRMVTLFGSPVGSGALPSTMKGMSSAQYWGSFVPRNDTMSIDRVLNQVPRDLDPYYSTVRAGLPSPWDGLDIRAVANVTDQDLLAMPRLIQRYNDGSITAAERDLLLRLARVHANGTPKSSPFVSYMTPDAPPPNVGERLFRVRIEVPRSMALDHRFENAEEAEILLSMDHNGRLTQVGAGNGPLGGSRFGSFVARHGTKIRWAGRAVVVASAAYSVYRVATAEEGSGGRVAGEEIGGLVAGTAGTVAAAAGCIALGVATGGVGLVICGLVGGAAAGALGSYVGGEVGDTMQHNPLGPPAWVVDKAVTAYTDSMIQSSDPMVRADGVAIRRVIYQDDSLSMIYLMNRMCGGCLSPP